MTEKIETLSEYLVRIMRQKRIKPRDIEERSGISNSYVSRLLKGEKKNIGVDTTIALAEALEVDPYELFAVVSGKSYEQQGIDLVGLTEAIETFILLPKEDQVSVLKTMKFLAQQRRKKHRKEKP